VRVADLRGAGGDEAGESVDELARLIQIGLVLGVVAAVMISTAGTSAMSRAA
jgi:hypothetical protein